MIAVGTDAQWVACARTLGLPALADDSSLSNNAGRLAQRERIVSDFTRAIAAKPAGAWRALLDAAGVPNGQVQSVLETLRDTNASALTGIPSSVGGSVRLAPPGLNQHGERIRELGWGAFDTIRS